MMKMMVVVVVMVVVVSVWCVSGALELDYICCHCSCRCCFCSVFVHLVSIETRSSFC